MNRLIAGCSLGCLIAVSAICQIPRPSDGDQQVLDQLKKAGSNLKKPHPIEFFLYFPTKPAAQRAAAEIKNDKFTVKVERGAQGHDWLCLATKKMVPSHTTLVNLRKRFKAIAAKYHGEYDGWGTPVVK